MINKKVTLKPGILVKTNDLVEHWFCDQDIYEKYIPSNSTLMFLYKALKEHKKTYRTDYVFLLNGKEIITYWSFDETDLNYLEQNLTEILDDK